MTAVVLVMGGSAVAGQDTESIAWERVAMTFAGVGVYLAIDNAVWPARINSALREGTVDVIAHTRVAAVGCSQALRMMLDWPGEQSSSSASSSPPPPSSSSEAVTAAADEGRSPGASLYDESSSVELVTIRVPAAEGQTDGLGTLEPLSTHRPDLHMHICSAAAGAANRSRGKSIAELGDPAQADMQHSLASAVASVEGPLAISLPRAADPAGRDDERMGAQFRRTRAIIDSELKDILELLEAKLAARRESLGLSVFEPVLWHKPFPLAAYQRLQASLDRVCGSLRAVSSAERFMADTMARMSDLQEARENVALLAGMSAGLIEVADTADGALGAVCSSIAE